MNSLTEKQIEVKVKLLEALYSVAIKAVRMQNAPEMSAYINGQLDDLMAYLYGYGSEVANG